MATNAFGQSPDAGNNDIGSSLAKLAINIGGAFATAEIAKGTAKKLTPSKTTTYLLIGGGVVVFLGGLGLVALLITRK